MYLPITEESAVIVLDKNKVEQVLKNRTENCISEVTKYEIMNYKILIIDNVEYPVVNYEWSVEKAKLDRTKTAKNETLTIEIDTKISEKWKQVIFNYKGFNVTDKNGKSGILYLPSKQISNFVLWQKQYREDNLKIEMRGLFPEFDSEIKLESV